MGRTGDFPLETVRLLAEKAHHHCSNPSCGIQTIMPLNKQKRPLRVGEAAHIYGIGSHMPRHRSDLLPSQLSDITNGIWLCRNCHGLIDKSDDIYSAEMLFKWKREHEDYVKMGFEQKANYRQLVMSALDSKMSEASPLARQIAHDLPFAWEYKLTAELLYIFAEDLHIRAKKLKDGLYTKRGNFIEGDKYFEWISAKFAEASEIASVGTELINRKLEVAWGEPGTPGDKFEIYNTCLMIRDSFARQIEIEEDILFTYTNRIFNNIKDCVRGFSEFNMRELLRLSEELKVIFDKERPSGRHELKLTIGVHEGFDRISEVSKECLEKYISGRSE